METAFVANAVALPALWRQAAHQVLRTQGRGGPSEARRAPARPGHLHLYLVQHWELGQSAIGFFWPKPAHQRYRGP
ncbi:unnamed protein product [Merluccius merluccius]